MNNRSRIMSVLEYRQNELHGTMIPLTQFAAGKVSAAAFVNQTRPLTPWWNTGRMWWR